MAIASGMSTPSPARQRTLQLQERTFKFMCAILKACPRTLHDVPSRTLWGQLTRASMGSSGNLEEADEASSDADFISKMKIALRETKEARRWLRAMRVCQLTGNDCGAGLEQEAGELAAIFAKIVINVKARVERERQEKRQGRAQR